MRPDEYWDRLGNPGTAGMSLVKYQYKMSWKYFSLIMLVA